MSTLRSIPELILAVRRINAVPEGPLPLHAPVFAGNERAYVLDTLESTFVSSVGAYVSKFEDMLRETTGAHNVAACANGTSALAMALRLAGVNAEDLVLTQSLTFVATANAVSHLRADPVFLDVDDDSLGLSPDAVRDFLESHCERTTGGCRHTASGKRVAACLPMHTFGLPCRIEKLVELCADWDIPLVEDAAEALGSLRHGRHCGTFGLLGTLSFNGNKIVTAGGGGAILTNDDTLGRQAKHLTTTAKLPHRWEFRHDAVAWNLRLPNLNAALGCAQLEQLPYFVEEKRGRASAYAELLKNTPWTFVTEMEGCRSNYWLCAVLMRDREERDALLAYSHDAGVMPRPVWEPLHTLPMYRHCLTDALEITSAAASRLVNLPSGVRQCQCSPKPIEGLPA